MNGNGYDNCGDKSDESKTDRPFCGMLKYVEVCFCSNNIHSRDQ